MSQRQTTISLTVEELRRRFDESFAVAPQAAATDVEDFLAIRVGGGRYAIRLRDLAGLAAGRRIVPLPSADPALAGLAGTQGRLVPVYRLASLIGAAGGAGAGGGEEELTWLAVCGRDESVGFAFAALDGHLRVPRQDLFVSAADETAGAPTSEAIRAGGEIRHVLDLPSLRAAVRERAGAPATESER